MDEDGIVVGVGDEITVQPNPWDRCGSAAIRVMNDADPRMARWVIFTAPFGEEKGRAIDGFILALEQLRDRQVGGGS